MTLTFSGSPLPWTTHSRRSQGPRHPSEACHVTHALIFLQGEPNWALCRIRTTYV